MGKVEILAVEHDVSDKFDTATVAQELQADTDVYYSCTNDDYWQDEVLHDGSILIKLPYKRVKRMKKENVAKLMLQYARERLKVA